MYRLYKAKSDYDGDGDCDVVDGRYGGEYGDNVFILLVLASLIIKMIPLSMMVTLTMIVSEFRIRLFVKWK